MCAFPYDPSAVTVLWSGGDAGPVASTLLGSGLSLVCETRIERTAEPFASKSRAIRARSDLRRSGCKVRLLRNDRGYYLVASYGGQRVDAIANPLTRAAFRAEAKSNA